MTMVAMTVMVALAAMAGGGGCSGGGGGGGNGNDNGSGGNSHHVSCVLFFYVIDCHLSSEYSLKFFSHSQFFSVAFSFLFTTISCNDSAHLSYLLV